jgi:EAL domain-containing protein (putative c-di-GMP-specific phosphodiesterase class I)
MLFQSPRFQSAYELWHGRDLVHVQGRRERRVLLLSSSAMVVGGVCWGLYFISKGNWPIAALDLVLVLTGLCTTALIWHKQAHWAGIITFATLFSVICSIAWVFDTSTPQAPRTTHLYLLPLSVAALMAFRDSGAWLRYGVTGLCLLAMGYLSVSYGTPHPQYALPEHVRAVGAWIQTAAALGMLYVMLHVMQNDSAVRSLLEHELGEALVHGQFRLYYQPQLDSEHRVIGAEALIRWQHPQRGLILPGKFIEVAEQTGLILPIGQWVLQQACAQLRSWAGQPACRQLRLAVNISQLQFRQNDFVNQVLGLIAHYGIQPHLLELELTESMLVLDLPDIIEKMSALRAHGVSFSLDDFGTGYSSLSHLKLLPLTQLKIDQSFVRDVLTDRNDASIASTVVTLGHNLGLKVIAEGVESQGQYDFLAGCGCEYFQGYLFSPALPLEAFDSFALRNFQDSAAQVQDTLALLA